MIKINLSKAYLLPAILIASLPFIPLIAITAVAYALSGEIACLIISIAFAVSYAALIVVFIINSRDREHYMTLGEEELTIKPSKADEPFSIKYADITEVVYYRMTSLKGWGNFAYSKVLPRSFFIKHKGEDGEELLTLGGHITQDELGPLLEEKGLTLTVK